MQMLRTFYPYVKCIFSHRSIVRLFSFFSSMVIEVCCFDDEEMLFAKFEHIEKQIPGRKISRTYLYFQESRVKLVAAKVELTRAKQGTWETAWATPPLLRDGLI